MVEHRNSESQNIIHALYTNTTFSKDSTFMRNKKLHQLIFKQNRFKFKTDDDLLVSCQSVVASEPRHNRC